MVLNRERQVLIAGGAAAVLILFVFLVVLPGIDRLRSLGRAYAQANRDLAEVRRNAPELDRLERDVKVRLARVRAQAQTAESPAARLTALVQEAGFPSQSFSLKSTGGRDGEFAREETFDLRVENVTYLEAVKLAIRLENGPLPLAMRSVQLKSRYEDARYLDAVFRIGVLLPLSR